MDDTDIDDLPVVPDPTQARLTERQLVDYEAHRTRLVKWMLYLGKDPDAAQGYAFETVRRRCYNTDIFYRWVWDHEDEYTTQVTHDHADTYARELAYEDVSATHKTNVVKALKMLYRWRAYEFGDDEWDPDITFGQSDSPSQPRDFLTREERQQIREAALEYGSVPHYNSLTASQRREWKRHLSCRFRKPMAEISRAEFDRANGFKIPSLVWTSLDAGLRPTEVERARVSWVDTDNAVLRIPADDAAKSTDNWTVSLQRRTALMLEKWLSERDLYEKYDDTDRLWLTRESNPYQSTSLKYLLRNLCEDAGIPVTGRQMTWYAIRHSVGTYMAREEGLAAAQAQLRHQSVQTTMKYDQAPVEDRRDALDRMG